MEIITKNGFVGPHQPQQNSTEDGLTVSLKYRGDSSMNRIIHTEKLWLPHHKYIAQINNICTNHENSWKMHDKFSGGHKLMMKKTPKTNHSPDKIPGRSLVWSVMASKTQQQFVSDYPLSMITALESSPGWNGNTWNPRLDHRPWSRFTSKPESLSKFPPTCKLQRSLF